MAEALAEGFALPPLSPARLATVLSFPSERDRLETAVERAEAAVADNRHADALEALRGVLHHDCEPRLVLRALFAESWARMMLGDLAAARELAERGRSVAEAGRDEVDRAEALFRLGCVHFELSQISVASELFTLGLELCERTRRPCDSLRARLHEWRSRCRQRHREWDAARADAERALEFATATGDGLVTAHGQFQASLVAERTGQLLLARFYAEEALGGFEGAGDRLMVARTLNQLGRLTFLLGDADGAVARLESAAAAGRELGSEADAAAALSSIAHTHLAGGSIEPAEREARRAIEALGGRAELAEEAGEAQLVLGRALLAQGRLDEAEAPLAAAEEVFVGLAAGSRRAAVWLAQGDLALARGACDAGAALYRRAAELLRDLDCEPEWGWRG